MRGRVVGVAQADPAGAGPPDPREGADVSHETTSLVEPLGPIRLGPGPIRRGRPAVFLDRDGVLNDIRGGPTTALGPRSLAELSIAAGAPEAVARLRGAGFVLIVVTNQPDVRRGELTLETALAITRRVVDVLALDDAYVCVHDTADGCPCRKPRPGLVVRAARDWNVVLGTSALIGDRWVDVAAAHSAGVPGVLLERAYSWGPSGGVSPPADLPLAFRAPILAACVDLVLHALR
jgi:D-glycero-D-manno-heptose 1,7-bisphosphate phosphatase